ncbi:uncharacterized protein (TIGR02246 family) [Rhodanobacter sp. K2T2]|uniref:YybH family protein n=1 Tax=Rhodanobacter sp. K2T2 TaxID=2723085 RepID=UPI0015CB78D1|nr:nuclear transport factor 2 family protein [Rhodanobacter sp. K2T2]NYE28596.1 uncharacterized protein (TIGR02246 family) [Rhodanobacter sp. K2T2]
MRKISLCVAVLTAFLPLFALAAPAASNPSPQTEAAIRAQNALWSESFKQGDYQAIGRLYTKDGTLLQAGGDRVVGPAAIVNYFTKGAEGKAPATVTFSDYEFYGNEKVVAEVSDYTIRSHDGKLTSRGKQMLIFLKQGGAWKLHRDIWNDNGPLKPGDH